MYVINIELWNERISKQIIQKIPLIQEEEGKECEDLNNWLLAVLRKKSRYQQIRL